jgi:hypothetical protein
LHQVSLNTLHWINLNVTFRRSTRLALSLTLLLAPACLLAQGTISGSVTNKTTNKPAANDTVTLIRLAQGMQESTVTHTDARGHYKLELPDAGIHLVRVTHDKANYFGAAPPGTDHVDVDVYNAEPKVAGVTTEVEELHVEATATELHIVEVLEVQNASAPAKTQFGPQGFDFYLPEGARIARTGAVTGGGMPVPAAAAPLPDKPGHYTFLFPVRPGETQFGIFYSMPYTGSVKLSLQLANPVHTFAVVLPKSMTLSPDSSPLSLSQSSDANTQTYIAQNVSPAATPMDVTISGTGALPHQQDGGGNAAAPGGAQPSAADANANAQLDANGNPDKTRFGGGLGVPVDPGADRDPFSKYKWWILGGLALLLAAAAGVLLRKPPPGATDTAGLSGYGEGRYAERPYVAPSHSRTPAAYTQTSSMLPHEQAVQQVLKEELFALETDHLQRRVTDEQYAEIKAALKTVLDRVLTRQAASGAPSRESATADSVDSTAEDRA